MLFWSRMSLKWKISAELIPAGGVKGGEAQLPLALQHGRTDRRTAPQEPEPATRAGLGLAAPPVGERKPEPGERRDWDAASERRWYRSRLGTIRASSPGAEGRLSTLSPPCPQLQSLPSVQLMEGGRAGTLGRGQPLSCRNNRGMSALSAGLERRP